MSRVTFKADGPGYDASTAIACARVARLAYGSESGVRRLGVRHGLSLVWHKTAGSHFGLALANTEAIFVAFRGTNEWRDWLTNLNIVVGYSPLGGVHGGFLRAANLFLGPQQDGLLSALRRSQSGRTIWVTGHSLGGAIALLLAAHLEVVEGIHVAGVYTFGQPAVGSLAFRRHLSKKFPGAIFRFINSIDAVSDLPGLYISPRPLFLHGLTHVGNVRYFSADGRVYSRKPWVVNVIDQVRAVSKWGGFASLSVHAMKQYIRQLDAPPNRTTEST
jgi:pimeloyl-ACP methyl ester carboxylesterase